MVWPTPSHAPVPMPPSASPDHRRLLARIAQVRWVAVGLGITYAITGPHPGVSATPLLLLAAMATVYNSLPAGQSRWPRLTARKLMLATLAGDFMWITGYALVIAPLHDDFATVIGYVVLGSESGLLLGWRGAVAAVAVGAAALATFDAVQGRGAEPVAAIGFQAGTVAVAGVFTAVGATELRAQRRELDAMAAALARHARTDHLTGLGNARVVEETLGRMRGHAHGVLLVDVDGMRWVNIVYGHEAGDELLLAVARVLANVRDNGDVACRLGEDKFALILPGAGAQRTVAMADAVQAAVETVSVSTAELRLSVGCAWAGGDSDAGTDATLENADDALYAAKMRGGDCVVAQGAVERGSRWRLRDAVISAVEDQRGIYSVYQPVVRIVDGTTVGWEALSRPHHWPPGASVEALFVTAHRMGRGRDLDWRCRRSALWAASRLDGPLFVNINVSGLLDPVHGVDQMLLLCQWAQREPGQVILELSERDAIPDLQKLHRVLTDYRVAGFRFALDDLGEGQTTLEVVLAARPEFLKLARPLCQSARSDVAARSVVRALVTFAHDIGSSVIAEGVEDAADRAVCGELDIDLGQGWLFGRPMPAESLPASTP